MPSRKRAQGKQRKARKAAAALSSAVSNNVDGVDEEEIEKETLRSMLSNLSLDGGKNEDKKIMSECEFNSALMNMHLSDVVETSPPLKQDCPLCMYALPPNTDQSKYLPCCGQVICRSCDIRNNPFAGGQLEGFTSGSALMNCMPGRVEEMCAKTECAFCRSTDIFPIIETAIVKERERLESRANKGDSRALVELGLVNLNGTKQLEIISGKKSDRNASKALACFKEAASLGNCDAYYELAMLHKLKYEPANYLACLEKAAELGSMKAHVALADIASQMGNIKVSLAHHKVLAAAGYSKDSVDQLEFGYRGGYITKGELALSLRTYQAARKEYTNKERAQMELFSSGRNPDGSLNPARRFM